MGFALVELATWTDPCFEPLSTDARLLFLWSWTNPAATKCGIYRATEKMMRRALQDDPPATPERVEIALEELGRKPLVRYDPDAEVLWVVNRVRHANRSPKVRVSMQREVEQVPPSPLLKEFIRMYGDTLSLELIE